MRKRLGAMSPDELRREKLYQEDLFRHLVSDMPFYKNFPKTWYGRWWWTWKEIIVTIATIVFWTIVIIGAIAGLMVVVIPMISAM